jgi:hypothetical protein
MWLLVKRKQKNKITKMRRTETAIKKDKFWPEIQSSEIHLKNTVAIDFILPNFIAFFFLFSIRFCFVE